MAQKTKVSLKQVGVDKANTRIVVTTAAAAFLVIFAIIASISLVQQLMYQNRVIGVKKKAVAQLKSNIDNTNDLVTQYKAFVSTPQNVLGGNPNGGGPKDGSNAKIVLDALPSKYDFPAMTSSLEKLMNDQGVKIKSMTGTDDSLNQGASDTNAPVTATPIPFELTISGPAMNIHNALAAMELSIRPFQIEKVDITGDQQQLNADITGHTYYQPETGLSITMETVK